MAKRYVKKKKKKKTRQGCAIGVAMLLLAALTVVIVLLGMSSCRKDTGAAPSSDPGWYTDDLGRIDDEKALVQGMEAFEKKTGVRPYLTLLADMDPEELDIFAQDQYDALFSDVGHLLVVYDEWEDGVYYLAARAGSGTGLSAEDTARILNALEDAYAGPAHASYAAAFGAGFAQGAKAVTVSVGAGSGVGLLIALGLLLIVLSGVLVLVLRKRARALRRAELYEMDED